jgi:hypothetical protein
MLSGMSPLLAQPNLNFKRISVNWPTVELYMSVGCNGNPAYNMTAQDIRILDNGKEVSGFSLTCPNPTVRCSISAGLVFDASGSMAGAGNTEAIRAGKSFISLMDGVLDEATVVYFNDKVTVAQTLTTSHALLNTAMDALPATGTTTLWDGAYTGVEEIAQSATNECRAIILMTDGTGTGSMRTPQEVIELAVRNRIRVFTIGLGTSVSATELEMLALLTGGRYYQTPNAQQLSAIYVEISTIMFQGFQECRISYDVDCADGALHTVQLTLRDFCGGTDAKTRTYRAPLDSSTFKDLRIGFPDAEAYSGSIIESIPLQLRSALNGAVLPPLSFTVRSRGDCFSITGITTQPGCLLEGVPMTITPTPGGFRISTTGAKTLQDAGDLLYLTLQTGAFTDTTCCDLVIEDIVPAYGCVIPAAEEGEICVLPRMPVLNCGMDAPRSLTWNHTTNAFEPDPLKVQLRVFNTGGGTGENPLYRINYDPDALVLIAPLSSVQSGMSIAPGLYGEVTWELTPKYRSMDDSTVVCITATFDNHTSIDCCVKIFIPRAEADLRCSLTAQAIHIDTLQQVYTPEPFQVLVTVENLGSVALDDMRSEIVLPAELILAGPDAPSKYNKPVTPSQLPAQTFGMVNWKLAVAKPWPTSAVDVPVIVRSYSATSGDSTECRYTVHIPAMVFPFSFALQAEDATTICQGTSVTLDAGRDYAGQEYASYAWSTMATTQKIEVRSTGDYFCTVVDQAGRIGYSDTIHVSVLPAPQPVVDVLGSNPLCQGDTLTLEAEAGYASYEWSTGATTRSIEVRQAGTYFVVVEDSSGCIGSSANTVVTMLPAATRPTITRTGDVLTASRAASYQWLRGGMRLDGAVNQFYQVTVPGKYTVRIIDSNGCSAESVLFDVAVLDVADLSPAISAFDLYPNPTNGVLSLHLQLPRNGEATVELSDLLGRSIRFERHRVSADGLHEEWNLAGLSPGMYFLHVTVADTHLLRRVLLTRP